MFHLRYLVFAITLAFMASRPVPALACSCSNSDASACSVAPGTPLVFVGTVVRDTGESNWGDRTGRMTVDEVLHGLPADTKEVDVDTLAGTSCFMPLKLGDRYAIYGSRDPKNPTLVHYHACSFSFNVRGNELLLDALRAQERGEPARIIGVVSRRIDKYGFGSTPVSSVTVIASRDGETLETTTAADGQFEFKTVSEGVWKLEPRSPGLIADQEHDWPRKPLLSLTNNICAVKQLSVVSDGHIKGTVREVSGTPVSGVKVAVFNRESRTNAFDTLPFKEVVTAADGNYDLGGLPAQDYILAVNGAKYRDEGPYPPSFYGATSERDQAKVIPLADGQVRSGTDLELRPKRTAAVLIVHAEFEDGSPATATGDSKSRDPKEEHASLGAVLLDLTDVQRGNSTNKFEEPVSDGILRIPVWLGETYKVRVYRFTSRLLEAPGGGVRFSSTDWETVSGPIQIAQPETEARITLHLKPRPPIDPK
jgi:carboxypeptidase family protein